jgi:hypothetical protein
MQTLSLCDLSMFRYALSLALFASEPLCVCVCVCVCVLVRACACHLIISACLQDIKLWGFQEILKAGAEGAVLSPCS